MARSRATIIVLLVGAMVVLGLLIGQNSIAQADAQARAENESNTLFAMYRLNSVLLDAESGQRGYLLTNNPAYLQPYLTARQRYASAYKQAQTLIATAGGDDDMLRLRAIDENATRKFQELDHTVSLARGGALDAVKVIVGTNAGKAEMDRIRRDIDIIVERQAQRRADGFAHSRAVEARLLPLIFLLWVTIALLAWAGFVGERLRVQAQFEARQTDLLRDARDKATLLANELNHRVKNLFAVVLSIVQLSGRKEVDGKQVAKDISARVQALAQAHTAALDGRGVGATLEDLLRRVLGPYLEPGGDRVTLIGPRIEVTPEMVTPFALITHELATNALKYGALSNDDGAVAISWSDRADESGQRRLVLDWRERGAAAPDPATMVSGFGSRMTEAAAAQLRGTLTREWTAQGLHARLDTPLA